MQPASQIQSAIECLGQLFEAWHDGNKLPADQNFQRFAKSRRYIGSKDRHAIAARYYHVLRHLAILDNICERAPNYEAVLPYPSPTTAAVRSARMLMLAALISNHEMHIKEVAGCFDGEKFHPPALNHNEHNWLKQLADRFDEEPVDISTEFWTKKNIAPWLLEKMQGNFGDDTLNILASLQQEAPVDIRINTLKTNREELQQKLKDDGIETEITPHSLLGLRLTKRAPIFANQWFREGYFEMQDEGSQVAAELVKAKSGMRVIDFCAGAGGKTLAIAAQMKNKGRILAFDTSAKRLKDIPIRMRRAGVNNAAWHTIASESDSFLKRHKKTADRVLVDAPCSGTGTWRRNPDLKWRLRDADIAELTDLQQRIITSAARLVKQGGRLAYVTCSLLKEENENIITDFLEKHPDFKVVCAQKIWNKESTNNPAHDQPMFLYLRPDTDGTDGFFAAVLERVA